MSDNTELITEAKNYEGDNGSARWPSLICDLAAALAQAEKGLADARESSDRYSNLLAMHREQSVMNENRLRRELTELGTAFRDYKIVHPEGTR